MSLDVTIHSKETETVMCACCGHEYDKPLVLYTANITHNLGKMAKEAGIYKALWRPEEINATYAKDIIEIVEKGLIDLESRPEYFKKFNSPNGWGMYQHFVPFVSDYLNALKKYPESEITTDR